MIYNAVPLKFPKLGLGFLEIGATWLPYWLDRMNEHWEKRGEVEAPDLTRKPSDVVRNSSVYCTLESGESLLPQTVEYAGDHYFMYPSDFPYWDTEFPENIEALWNHSRLSTDERKTPIPQRQDFL